MNLKKTLLLSSYLFCFSVAWGKTKEVSPDHITAIREQLAKITQEIAQNEATLSDAQNLTAQVTQLETTAQKRRVLIRESELCVQGIPGLESLIETATLNDIRTELIRGTWNRISLLGSQNQNLVLRSFLKDYEDFLFLKELFSIWLKLNEPTSVRPSRAPIVKFNWAVLANEPNNTFSFGNPPKVPSYSGITNNESRERHIHVAVKIMNTLNRLYIEHPEYNQIPGVRAQILQNIPAGYYQDSFHLSIIYDFWHRYSQKEISIKAMDASGKIETLVGTLVDMGENGDFLDPYIVVDVKGDGRFHQELGPIGENPHYVTPPRSSWAYKRTIPYRYIGMTDFLKDYGYYDRLSECEKASWLPQS